MRGNRKIWDSYDEYIPLESTQVFPNHTSTLEKKDIKQAPPLEVKKCNHFSEVVELIGVPLGDGLFRRSFYKIPQKLEWVPTLHYEFKKGFTVIYLTHAKVSRDGEDLVSLYENYRVAEESKSEKDILTFPDWVSEYFRPYTPPSTWDAGNQEWLKMRMMYETANLIFLNAKQRKDYEIKIINGLCYVRPSHPHKICNRQDVIQIDDEDWELIDPSQRKPEEIKNYRGEALIFVFAKDRQTAKKILLVASDWPGIFHHTSFNDGSLIILTAGTMIIKKGVIIYIDNESGHYNPNQNYFMRVIAYLENENALNNQTEISYFSKKLTIDSFSLYLVKKFDPEKKCEIKGNAVILDNKNTAYYIKNGNVVMKYAVPQKEHHKTLAERLTLRGLLPHTVEKIDRHGIPLSDSDEPQLATAQSEATVRAVIYGAAIRGGYFSMISEFQRLFPDQVNTLRRHIRAKRELLQKMKGGNSNSSRSISVDTAGVELTGLPEVKKYFSVSGSRISLYSKQTTGTASKPNTFSYLKKQPKTLLRLGSEINRIPYSVMLLGSNNGSTQSVVRLTQEEEKEMKRTEFEKG